MVYKNVDKTQGITQVIKSGLKAFVITICGNSQLRHKDILCPLRKSAIASIKGASNSRQVTLAC